MVEVVVGYGVIPMEETVVHMVDNWDVKDVFSKLQLNHKLCNKDFSNHISA